MQVWRNDRFGRGGDHTEMLNAGFPAVRFSVAVENYDHQHQDLRTEKGVEYGDTVDKMDFAYLRKVTQLNVAALAAIASAPPPPEPTRCRRRGAAPIRRVKWTRGHRDSLMPFTGVGPMIETGRTWRRCHAIGEPATTGDSADPFS